MYASTDAMRKESIFKRDADFGANYNAALLSSKHWHVLVLTGASDEECFWIGFQKDACLRASSCRPRALHIS